MKQNVKQNRFLELWDILSGKPLRVVIGYSDTLVWFVLDSVDVDKVLVWLLDELFLNFETLHVPEVALGSGCIWNVDYKDISEEDKEG